MTRLEYLEYEEVLLKEKLRVYKERDRLYKEDRMTEELNAYHTGRLYSIDVILRHLMNEYWNEDHNEDNNE